MESRHKMAEEPYLRYPESAQNAKNLYILNQDKRVLGSKNIQVTVFNIILKGQYGYGSYSGTVAGF